MNMFQQSWGAVSRTSRLVAALTAVSALLMALILPALQGRASAAQLTDRYIQLGSSVASETDVYYRVGFTIATTGNNEAIIIDFCDESPLVGSACDDAALAGFSTNEANLVFSVTINAVDVTANYAKHANTDANTLILTRGTGSTAVTAGHVAVVTLGNATEGGADDGIANPTSVGSFYGRILTYSQDTDGATYNSETTGATNPTATSLVDTGGVAMSTANQLTISARVQEQLSFCVGGTTVNDATAAVMSAADCAGTFTGAATCGNTVDLGVVGTTPVTSPVATGTGGNTCNGTALLSTNASDGAVVTYIAEPPSPDAIGTHLGQLKVPGATCVASSTTDQCFNSAGASQTNPAGEYFGMTIAGVNCGLNGDTNYTCDFPTSAYNLVRDTDYDGAGAGTYGVTDGFAWVESYQQDIDRATDTRRLAASTTVVDNEALIFRYSARSTLTTPSGTYSVLSTYIATSQF